MSGLSAEREQELRAAAANGGIAFENTAELRALFATIDACRQQLAAAQTSLAETKAEAERERRSACRAWGKWHEALLEAERLRGERDLFEARAVVAETVYANRAVPGAEERVIRERHLRCVYRPGVAADEARFAVHADISKVFGLLDASRTEAASLKVERDAACADAKRLAGAVRAHLAADSVETFDALRAALPASPAAEPRVTPADVAAVQAVRDEADATGQRLVEVQARWGLEPAALTPAVEKQARCMARKVRGQVAWSIAVHEGCWLALGHDGEHEGVDGRWPVEPAAAVAEPVAPGVSCGLCQDGMVAVRWDRSGAPSSWEACPNCFRQPQSSPAVAEPVAPLILQMHRLEFPDEEPPAVSPAPLAGQAVGPVACGECKDTGWVNKGPDWWVMRCACASCDGSGKGVR